ncbi:MAG: LemA family protein [Bowdeniella nasicola]|nr:LemA family protein [Bowdeniella nasicola]
MDVTSTVITIVVIVLLVAVSGALIALNALKHLRWKVNEAWRQITVELTRRHDLIPNLIAAVSEYEPDATEVYQALEAARSKAMSVGSTPAEQTAQENELSARLADLFELAERHRDLRALAGFQQLQAELTNTEDRIAAGRRYYNANARELNTRRASFPSSLLASLFHYRRAELFETTDPAVRATPNMEFRAERDARDAELRQWQENRQRSEEGSN